MRRALLLYSVSFTSFLLLFLPYPTSVSTTLRTQSTTSTLFRLNTNDSSFLFSLVYILGLEFQDYSASHHIHSSLLINIIHSKGRTPPPRFPSFRTTTNAYFTFTPNLPLAFTLRIIIFISINFIKTTLSPSYSSHLNTMVVAVLHQFNRSLA